MTDKRTPLTRRGFLTAVGAGVASALAGCVEQTNEPIEPSFNQSKINEQGWSAFQSIDMIDTKTFQVLGRRENVRFQTKGKAFERGVLAQRIEETFPQSGSLGELLFPLVIFGGMKTRSDPSAAVLPEVRENPRQIILNAIEPPIRRRLNDFGIEDIERTGTGTMTVETGEEAAVRTYSVMFPYAQTRVNVGGQTVLLEDGVFELEAKLAVWFHNGVVATTFGLYPQETGDVQLSYETRTETENLGFTPDAYRANITSLMKQMD